MRSRAGSHIAVRGQIELHAALPLRIVALARQRLRVIVLVQRRWRIVQALAQSLAASGSELIRRSVVNQSSSAATYSRKCVMYLRLQFDQQTCSVSAPNVGVMMCTMGPTRGWQPILAVSWNMPKLWRGGQSWVRDCYLQPNLSY